MTGTEQGRRPSSNGDDSDSHTSSGRRSQDLSGTSSFLDVSAYFAAADADSSSYSPLVADEGHDSDEAGTSSRQAPSPAGAKAALPLVQVSATAEEEPSTSASGSQQQRQPLAPTIPWQHNNDVSQTSLMTLTSTEQPSSEDTTHLLPMPLSQTQPQESPETTAPPTMAAQADTRKTPRVARFKEMFRSISPSSSGNNLNVEMDTSYHGIETRQALPNANQFDRDDDDDDHEELVKGFKKGAPLDCHSLKDVHVRRRSSLYIIQIVLSIYSTVVSGIWLVVALYQPRYGRGVSSSSQSSVMLSPSSASVLSTLFSKTIEMSFVTVFVACLGQVLSRRAFVRQANGVTLSEMTMRNWVVQPGSLFTYWQGIPRAGTTLTGALALTAAVAALLYTTAADALVSPKLKFGEWYPRELQGLVQSSYSNPTFVRDTCPTPIDRNLDEVNHGASCLDIKYSGQSYHNLLTFMTDWEVIHARGDREVAMTMKTRPSGKHSLFDNTTMTSSWIETSYGDPIELFKKYGRVVNNVTLAMPHPGVYEAAVNPINGILQPIELSGVGEYALKAAVVSPAVNVMCVNMNKTELGPLVYTEWPNVVTSETGIPGVVRGHETWFNEVPPPRDGEWLNRTVVDDVFLWGEKYKRRPPVFQMFPHDFNMITNTTVANSDGIYLLAKSAHTKDYTICEMRSWMTTKCSTEFKISGIAGGTMRAHCEDPDDKNSYLPYAEGVQPAPSVDWKNMVDQWRLSMDLNGGISTSNASTSRIMTNFILTQPQLDPLLPTMAEAMAALSASTLIGGALKSTYKHFWGYDEMILDHTQYETFPIVIQEQQYTSAYESDWQRVFYIILALVFVINVACFLYLVFRRGMVTDFTEPQNMFSLAINSPPSTALRGSCGGGPDSTQLRKPWRISYSEAANHYYFQETRLPSAHGVADKVDELHNQHHLRELKRSRDEEDEENKGDDFGLSSGASTVHPEGRYRSSYRRLATSKVGTWL